MIVLRNLIKLNRNLTVLKTLKQLDIKYSAAYCMKCCHKNDVFKIKILPATRSKITGVRNMSTFDKITARAEEKIRTKDGVPSSYSLIYRAPMILYCKIAYPLSLISATLVPASVFINRIFFNSPLNTGTMGPLTVLQDEYDLLIFTLGSVIFGTCLILFILKFPFRIFHQPDSDKYIAVLSSVIPFKTKHFHFSSASKVNPKEIVMGFFKDSSYQLGSKRLFLLERHFKTQFHLERMLKLK